jgi:hypothetical protein
MTTIAIAFNDFVLPWEATRKEDERFRRILERLLLLFLLLSIVFPWLPLPYIEEEKAEIIPPAMAKLIIHQKLPAAPAPPPPPKPEPVQAEKSAEGTGGSPGKLKNSEPGGSKPGGKKVASMGVAAFSNRLQSLRSSLDVAKLQARNTNIKTGAAERSTRSVLGRVSATKTSGGIDYAVMSGNGSGTQLAERSGGGGNGSGAGYGGGSGGDMAMDPARAMVTDPAAAAEAVAW